MCRTKEVFKWRSYLEEIDRTSDDMFEQLVTQMAERDRVTEQLKAEDQMTWVQCMNNIRHCVEEIVRIDLIEN